MLRKLFNLLRYAVDVEIQDNPRGRQLHIRLETHYGGIATDLYVARWRGVSVYCEHLSYYAGKFLLARYEPVVKESLLYGDYTETVTVGPVEWTGWESQGHYVETLKVFGRSVSQRV